MGSVNVNRNLSDQFYRYKMPKIIAKVEGKGNGIKTVIVNMVEVAKALDRPPMYPTKYFGCVLGAQVNCDPKNDRYIVNGAHDAAKLQDLLDGFIQKYVLCPNCENPETILGVYQKKGIITTTCRACGHCGNLPTTDKLSTYILKYPPPNPKAMNGSSSVPPSVEKDKGKKGKGKKGKEDAKKNGEANGRKSPNESNSDEFESLDVNGSAGEVNGSKVDETDWGEDTSPEAVEARARDALSAKAKAMMLNDDIEKTVDERLEIFHDYLVKNAVDKHGVDQSYEIALQKEIVAEAERLDVRDKAVIVLCQLLLGDKTVQRIKVHRVLFLRFTAENKKAQKYLLRGFEQLVKQHEDQLLNKVALILKAFYDADIIDEDMLIEWGKKKPKKSAGKIMEDILNKASPFIKWLEEAESESSSEDEEELEVGFDDRVSGAKIESLKEEIKSPAKTIEVSAKAEEDDINIDDI